MMLFVVKVPLLVLRLGMTEMARILTKVAEIGRLA